MKTEFTINVRPLRHVYFIAEDDLKRFTDVAGFCCTQWGGINNLIIPIPVAKTKETDTTLIQKDSLVAQIITQCSPDIFIDAVSLTEEGDSTFYKSLMSWLASEYPRKPIEKWETFLTTDQSLHPLNITSSQMNVSKPVLSLAVFPSYADVSDLENAIRCAAFGTIWPGQEKDYREAYEVRMWPVDMPGANIQLQLSTDPYTSVINLTLKEMHNIGTENVFPSLHFDVVIAQTVWDLCWFWNLRAQSFGHQWLDDRRVLILSKTQLFQESNLESLFRILRERRVHPYMTSNVDVIFHHYHDEEISQFVRSRSELQEHKGSLQVNMQFPPRDSNSETAQNSDIATSSSTTTLRPIIYEENKLPNLCVYHEYGGNRPTFSVVLSEDSESFLVPDVGPRTVNSGTACIGLQSDFWNQFPCDRSVANLIIPDSSFDVFLNTIQLSYQHTLPPGGLGRISVKLPKTWDIYKAYFRAQGYEVSPSDKSFYANGLIGIAGGLEQAEILLSHIAYRILDTLADKSTQKLARELHNQLSQQGLSLPQGFEEYLQGVVTGTSVIPQFKRNPRTFSKIKEALDRVERSQCLRVLSELVRIKAVQRGLDVKCPHCQTTIWYSISDLDEHMRCLGCLETFDLPLTENALDPADRSFQYSLNPLVNRAMDQDVLPVITALLTLKTVHAHVYHVVPGMNFKPVGSTHNTGDFDFVYIYKHELFGGECKAGEMLSQKDINTARVARQLGFRAFFFVTTKRFREEVKELIRIYQQELTNDMNTDRPFSIFMLDEEALFEGKPLSKEIPQ